MSAFSSDYFNAVQILQAYHERPISDPTPDVLAAMELMSVFQTFAANTPRITSKDPIDWTYPYTVEDIDLDKIAKLLPAAYAPVEALTYDLPPVMHLAETPQAAAKKIPKLVKPVVAKKSAAVKPTVHLYTDDDDVPEGEDEIIDSPGKPDGRGGQLMNAA